MKLRIAMLALLVAVAALPVQAGDKPTAWKLVSDATVRMVSEATYSDLLRRAMRKGWRYTPEQIERGYRRHFEEFKLQLIGLGYTIVVGEAGA
jgi:hypothetical protein